METLGKIIRGIASIPVVGGALVFVLGFLPVIAVIPLNLSNGLSMIIGGLLMAAWCYFLNAKKLINIVTPLIPIPLWILGIVMSIAGVYGIVTNKWDDKKVDTEMVPQEITPSKTVQEPTMKPESKSEVHPGKKVENEAIHEQSNSSEQDKKIDLDTERDKASEYALEQMEKALEDMKNLKETLGEEKIQEIYDSQGSDNTMNFEEAMAEIQKQIDDLKQQGYGAE